MADHIPFITGDEGIALANKYYGDSVVMHVQLERAHSLATHLPKTIGLWIGPCVDGCHAIERKRTTPEKPNQWFDFMAGFSHFDRIGRAEFHKKPVGAEVDAFVKDVLNKCATYKPAWITIPQLPVVDGAALNKINRLLAEAAGKWKSTTRFSGRLILPLVFTNQRQLNNKTDRNPKVQLAEKCYHDAGADGIWVVDESLDDENQSVTLRHKRFQGLIALHEELNHRISSTIRIAGPYWGLNLVLWAKGLVNYPAIGVGSGYQYFIPGDRPGPPSARIAIPSLRRRVGATTNLGTWLDKSISTLGGSNPVHAEFSDLKKKLTVLHARVRARGQVADFYKKWFDKIASAPREGRPMALFQDLSVAYALGKSLSSLDDEGTVRRPESIAEPLMMNCL